MKPVIEVGTYVIVFIVENGGAYHVIESHWDELTAALGNWIERRIDRALTLTTHYGADVVLAASRISEVTLSTPEARARQREMDAARKAEGGFAE